VTDPLVRHLDTVFGYLALRLHPDRELARDLCQEVFRAALSRRGSLRTPAAARAGLLGIARHRPAPLGTAQHRVSDHFRGEPGRALELDGHEPATVGPDDRGERLDRAAFVAATLRGSSVNDGRKVSWSTASTSGCSTRTRSTWPASTGTR